MTVTIRPATRRDAADIACLMDIAGHGIEAEAWMGWRDEDHSALSAARQKIITDEMLPHHVSKVSLLEADGEVAGLLAGERVAEQQAIHGDYPAYFRPLLELEAAVAGFWTVVALALYREHRGRGFSTLLLRHALARAAESKAKGLSIVVEDTNLTALTAYRRFGFKEHNRCPWLPYGSRSGPKDWVLLTRPLD